MYVPTHFAETDPAALHGLIRNHPLGTWITQADGELVVNHLPLLLDPNSGPHGTLRGHVARANPVWQSLSVTRPSIVVFQGPESYISPNWYPAKREHGKVVPTWNYAVVHAHGAATAIHDRDWLLRLVTSLTDTHEAREAQPWKVADAPADYAQQLLERIVGIEIVLTKLVGKWKVSQNRSRADRLGTAAGLEARNTAAEQAMAELVRRHITGSEESR